MKNMYVCFHWFAPSIIAAITTYSFFPASHLTFVLALTLGVLISIAVNSVLPDSVWENPAGSKAFRISRWDFYFIMAMLASTFLLLCMFFYEISSKELQHESVVNGLFVFVVWASSLTAASLHVGFQAVRAAKRSGLKRDHKNSH